MSELLRAIAASEPHPWFPSEFAKTSGKPREAFDESLNRLRVAGLVRMTDWEAGKGQGYFLTTEGQRALGQPAQIVESRTNAPSAPQSKARIQAVTDDNAITRLLIAAQVGVFAVGLVQSLEAGRPANAYLATGSSPVLSALAVSQTAIVHGAWWTLLSYALVHAGALHLGCNLLGHYYDGSLLERLIGRLRFLVIYLLAVLFGAVGALLTARAPNVSTVGSSGGLCGIFAAQFVFFLTQRHLFHHTEWRSLTQHYLRVTFLIVIISAVPGVSWGGHLGGAIGGILGGLFLVAAASRTWTRRIGWVAMALLPLAAIALIWWRLLR